LFKVFANEVTAIFSVRNNPIFEKKLVRKEQIYRASVAYKE